MTACKLQAHIIPPSGGGGGGGGGGGEGQVMNVSDDIHIIQTKR
jgi:hypothetical protein